MANPNAWKFVKYCIPTYVWIYRSKGKNRGKRLKQHCKWKTEVFRVPPWINI